MPFNKSALLLLFLWECAGPAEAEVRLPLVVELVRQLHCRWDPA